MVGRATAAIFCGGQADKSRLRTGQGLETMTPVGPKKLPLLSYIIRLISHYGITDISLLTGHHAGAIGRYFGDGSRYQVKITYSEGPPGRQGNLSALAHALGRAVPTCDELLVCEGEAISDLDVASVLSTHRKKRADVTLVLAKGYRLPIGVAEVDAGGRVVRIREKPKLGISVGTGWMVMGERAMILATKLAKGEGRSLMSDLVPSLLERGGRVAAYYTNGEWFNAKTRAAIERLDAELGRARFAFLSR